MILHVLFGEEEHFQVGMFYIKGHSVLRYSSTLANALKVNQMPESDNMFNLLITCSSCSELG